MEVTNSYIFWKYAYQKALTQVNQEQCRWSALCMTVVHWIIEEQSWKGTRELLEQESSSVNSGHALTNKTQIRIL